MKWAIVLIIIGIIIGAVVKGKDVMKSAEQKRLYSTFVREWQMAYNNYYDRTGWILGDDVDASNTTRDGHCGNGNCGAGSGTGRSIDPGWLEAAGRWPHRTVPTSEAIRMPMAVNTL